VDDALHYFKRIQQALPPNSHFQPLMVLYLTEQTTVAELEKLAKTPEVVAVKYYPAGATTNADAGVSDLDKVWTALEAMQDLNIPLLIHGEVTDPDIDIFDREQVFIERSLSRILTRLPRLKVVLEHITTEQAAHFVQQADDNLAATITAHHLLMNRNAIFQGGIRPHHYCLPVLKRERHRIALLEAATSGNPRFFLGTDSAPHAQHFKESACGCAGMYTAPAALELYAEAFAQRDALDKLEGFSSFYGADFYGLPRNTERLTLIRQAWKMPSHFALGDSKIIPFRAGETIHWTINQ
jgi:dihydroorotase